jgi:hypothetical protein
MDLFDYVSYSDPKRALEVYRQYSRIRVTDEQELSDGLRAVMKGLRMEDKEDFLTKLAMIHPDRQMLMETQTEIKSDPDDDYTAHKCNCPHCMMKAGAHGMAMANGQNAVTHFMNSGAMPEYQNNQTKALETELQNIKQETKANKLMNDKIFQLVTLGILGFLIYKFAIKK